MPILGPGEALVGLLQASICATDLQLVRGYRLFRGTLGHEFVGVVVEAADSPAMVGQRVVGEINLACGNCFQCRRGRPSHCDRRQVLGIRGRDGTFAEYLSLPLGNLHPVSDSIPDEAAVFNEPLAAALGVIQQVAIRPNDRVLVVGAGRLGQLIARLLRLTGCDLSVVARNPSQRQLLAMANVASIAEVAVAERRSDLVVEAAGVGLAAVMGVDLAGDGLVVLSGRPLFDVKRSQHGFLGDIEWHGGYLLGVFQLVRLWCRVAHVA